MSAPLTARNTDLLAARRQGASHRDLARRFGISQPRVAQLLAQGTGDPLLLARLPLAGERELTRARLRLEEKIGRDLATLVVIEEELGARVVDRILGLADRP